MGSALIVAAGEEYTKPHETCVKKVSYHTKLLSPQKTYRQQVHGQSCDEKGVSRVRKANRQQHTTRASTKHSAFQTHISVMIFSTTFSSKSIKPYSATVALGKKSISAHFPPMPANVSQVLQVLAALRIKTTTCQKINSCHCHTTGEYRYLQCRSCQWIGKSLEVK